LFNPRKSEIFLSSIEIVYICSLVFTLSSFFIFQSFCEKTDQKFIIRLKYLILMIMCVIFAYLSSGQGIISFMSISVIWVLHERKKCFKNPFFYIWIIFAITCFFIYFTETSINQNYSITSSLLEKPFELFHYFFRFIGNIANNSIIGFIIFIISIIIFLDFLRHNRSTD
jgi:hypothetical protein